MKVKEYFEEFTKKGKEYLKEDTRVNRQMLYQITWDICEKFAEETKQLIKVRHAQSKGAINSVVKEMDNKWRMLNKKHPIFQENDYMERIQKEDFMKEKPAEQKSINTLDTMCDIRELQRENIEKFRKIRNQ